MISWDAKSRRQREGDETLLVPDRGRCRRMSVALGDWSPVVGLEHLFLQAQKRFDAIGRAGDVLAGWIECRAVPPLCLSHLTYLPHLTGP